MYSKQMQIFKDSWLFLNNKGKIKLIFYQVCFDVVIFCSWYLIPLYIALPANYGNSLANSLNSIRSNFLLSSFKF